MNWIGILISYLPLYLLGAFPTGYLLAKLRGVDITAHGSGNVGASNVARVLGKKAGLITLLVDVLKGLLGVTLVEFMAPASWYVGGAAVAVVAGHCFSVPPFLRGGKGVATALGAIVGLSPLAALVAVGVFSAVFAASRIVSLASISAALAAPLIGFVVLEASGLQIALTIIALIVTYRHRENLKRLSEGREPKFSPAKKL